MDKDQRSVRPVIEYIMNQFPEPFSHPMSPYASHLSTLLYKYIKNQISFNDCCVSIYSITGCTYPVEKLKSILSVSKQPLPSSPTYFDQPTKNSYDDEIEDQNEDNHLSDRKRRKKCKLWNNIEDERLLAAILKFGLDNWSAISRFIGNDRTRSQCCQRWTRGLDPRISKDQWTAAEDKLLTNLVQSHGTKSWTQIASILGNRSDVQCRYHYQQLVKTNMASDLNHSFNTAGVTNQRIPQTNSTGSIHMNFPKQNSFETKPFQTTETIFGGQCIMPNIGLGRVSSAGGFPNSFSNYQMKSPQIDMRPMSFEMKQNSMFGQNFPNMKNYLLTDFDLLPKEKANVSNSLSFDKLPKQNFNFSTLPNNCVGTGISSSKTLGSLPIQPPAQPQQQNLPSPQPTSPRFETDDDYYFNSMFSGIDDLINDLPEKWFLDKVSKEPNAMNES